MNKLHTSIVINAPIEKVWHTMLDDATYRVWTSAFNEGSYYRGEWRKGAKMLFLGPSHDGGTGEGGMVSRIADVVPNKFVSIEHLGVVANGVEDTTSEFARQWAPAFENYTFTEVAGGTEVRVDMDVKEEYYDEFAKMWEKALPRLKQVAEAITVETMVRAPLAHVWRAWTEPAHITQWAFASSDWEAPSAENDVRVGGRFKTVMAAKDKSTSFDFVGTYTEVQEHAVIAYDMDDGRHVVVTFTQIPEGVKIAETFDPERENPAEMQRAGWQSILDTFARYAERTA